VNFAAWCVAAVIAAFGLLRLADPASGGAWIGPLNLAVAALLVALPLLHRFGPLVVPVLFLLLADAFIFWVNALVGTGGGVHFFYLTSAASSARAWQQYWWRSRRR
jgi:adenylate cyclase